MRRTNFLPKSVKRFTLLIKCPVYGITKDEKAGLVIGIGRLVGEKYLDW